MSGYSVRLALRHLFVGLMRPREATREAVEAGLGELWRMSLIILATGAVALINDQTRTLFDRQAAETEQSLLAVLIASWILVVLVVGAFHYFIGSVFAFAMLAALRSPDLTFSGVRSAWAMAMWITSLPVLVYMLCEPSLPDQLRSDTWYNPFALTLIVIWTTYRTCCFTEVSGASPSQALGGASFAALGLHVLSGVFSRLGGSILSL